MKRFARSLTHAGKGILFTLKNERNFQIEAVATGVVGLLMAWLPLSTTENIFLILATTAVLTIELVNTAIERVMDILKPRIHPYARVVKDIMAGAVLVVSCGALLTGIIIFSPHFF
ncbi:MAG: diacylglycerol kinase family protein [Candidatus Moranbacteria bacterium]|nr:diacylglycerol kinase family protein [Candidatus Moranbacteria bacterium]